MKLLKNQISSYCFTLILAFLYLNMSAGVGDTVIVQTFRYDTTMRAGVFVFPDDTTKTYEKIIMQYSMRCKNGLISDAADRNKGCGEWDYNCYTYIVDSSQTDSLLTKRNSHDISNFTGSVFNYTTSPVYTYTQYNQQQITYNSVTSEDTSIIGTGTDSLESPLGASASVSRSQYLWTTAELAAAGLTAGNITAIRLDVSSLGSELKNLRIRIKHTTKTILNPSNPELSGFTQVYFLNTTLTATGIQSFNFYNPFNWNGTQNIIVEFSYTNEAVGINNIVAGHNAGFNSSLTTTSPDSYLNFSGNVSYIKLNPSFYDSISNEITIAFWCFGDSVKLPKNTSIMEAYNSSNQRHVNIHLPWSDSNVYWDCGNNGSGSDRISKAATPADLEGRWNFWAFTKNATTGLMRIYLNGVLWQSGTGKTKPIDINNFIVGKGITGNPYFGNFDELSIWNKELSQSGIQSIMYSDIESNHPNYSNLLCYHKMNEDNGDTLFDSSPNGYNSFVLNPAWGYQRGNSLFRNFSISPFRPNTQFIKGIYNSSIQSFPVLDSTLSATTSVISYAVSGNSLNVVDTNYVWPSGYTYIYNELGVKIDSIAVAIQNTINITTLTYYRVRPMRVELINFITPYGIGLDLDGLNGKTWEFDVTDYAPILKGAKYMAMEDGKYQEENDIKFVFYEGSPSRNVKSVSQVWPSGSWVSPSYSEIVNNTYFEPRTLDLSPNASGFKIRSSISGHGQEGEFIPRNHTITLNGSTSFTRQVWKECATNPIYPQGGTWVGDRAGWCPGAAVDVKEYDMSSLVSSGQTITLDYSLPSNPSPAAGTSNYRINNQLVSYGTPNFNLNAEVDYIKSPSDKVETTRFNPICSQPVISIKNSGSDTLTSLDITYGRVGCPLSTYQWNGSLAFLETELITLPSPNWLGSNKNDFIVVLNNPNGGTDQYTHNDTMYSSFSIPAMFPSSFVVELRTNARGSETSYNIKDNQGNTIFSKSGLSSNRIYRDTFNLNTGCYALSLNDAGDDGLDYWANPGQGTGYLVIKNATNGVIYKTYEPDFGDNIYEQFTLNYVMPVNEIEDVELGKFIVYPNPVTSDFITAEFELPVHSLATIKLTNLIGQELISETYLVSKKLEKIPLDISAIESGIYFVTIEAGNIKKSKRLVITK